MSQQKRSWEYVEPHPHKKTKVMVPHVPNSMVLLQCFREMQQAMANLILTVNNQSKEVEKLSQTIRQQQYSMDSLQREVSDLQSHAINGTLTTYGNDETMEQDTAESPRSNFNYYC
jgi:septal ring factor EnvC (AmiA/AmiB activator)